MDVIFVDAGAYFHMPARRIAIGHEARNFLDLEPMQLRDCKACLGEGIVDRALERFIGTAGEVACMPRLSKSIWVTKN